MKKLLMFVCTFIVFTAFFQPVQAFQPTKRLGVTTVPASENIRSFGAIVVMDELNYKELYAVKITVCSYIGTHCSVIDWFLTALHPQNERFLEYLNAQWTKTFPQTNTRLEIWVEFPEPATELKILMSLEAAAK